MRSDNPEISSPMPTSTLKERLHHFACLFPAHLTKEVINVLNKKARTGMNHENLLGAQLEKHDQHFPCCEEKSLEIAQNPAENQAQECNLIRRGRSTGVRHLPS